MTDFTQLSDKELSEAIDFHRRQRNMSRGVNESMHMRQVQTVRLLEAEEARRLDEAQVKKPTKSERSIALPDGEPNRSADMKVNKVAYALDKEPKKKVSLPKAPWNEEAELDEAAFDDESKAHDRHYEKQTPAVQNALDKYTRQGMSYKQAHAKISNPLTGHRLRKEITPLHEEQIDELKKSTLASYVKKASTDQYLKGQAVQYHTNKAQTADGVFAKQSKEKHYDAADKALKKASNRDTGIGRAVDRLAKEEAEKQLFMDPDDKMWKVSYDHGPHQSNTIKVKAKSQSHAWEVAKEVAKRKYGHTRITSGSVESMKEEVELDEKNILGSIVKGTAKLAYKGAKTALVNNKGNFRFSTAGKADAADERAKKAEKLNRDRERIRLAQERLRKARERSTNEEAELDEASYRDSGYANMLKASRKADKEADKMRAKHEKEAKKAGEPKAEFKEEADLRITKVYNKWPKKATYAVHTPDRKYFKEFDTMEAAKAHHAEKSGK